MPLDSSKLTEGISNGLREMPYDIKYDLPYPTKVDMYDSKCSGCGFARIEVVTIPMEKMGIFNKIEDALFFAQGKSVKINRLCSYPVDVDHVFNEVRYLTLTEIICNTCQFWNINKLRIFSDVETEFIEIESVEKMREPRHEPVSQE